jgi:hypothetical protein
LSWADFFKEARMSKTYVHKNCEIYLPGSPYREDMVSLPLDCFLDEEEYDALPEEKKQDYCLLVGRQVPVPGVTAPAPQPVMPETESSSG